MSNVYMLETFIDQNSTNFKFASELDEGIAQIPGIDLEESALNIRLIW